MAGVEAMTLVSGEAFPRHSHDQFGIGLIDVGGHRSWSAVGQVDAGAGDAIMANPGELHDGASIDGGVRAWRMLYFEPWLAIGEVEDEIGEEVEIVRPAVHDPILAALFSRLFSIATAPIADRLAADEGLMRLLSHALRQHGSRRPLLSGVSPNVGKARRRLDQAPEKPVSLAELAALVGISRLPAAARLCARDRDNSLRLSRAAPGALCATASRRRPIAKRGGGRGGFRRPKPYDQSVHAAVWRFAGALPGRALLRTALRAQHRSRLSDAALR